MTLHRVQSLSIAHLGGCSVTLGKLMLPSVTSIATMVCRSLHNVETAPYQCVTNNYDSQDGLSRGPPLTKYFPIFVFTLSLKVLYFIFNFFHLIL